MFDAHRGLVPSAVAEIAAQGGVESRAEGSVVLIQQVGMLRVQDVAVEADIVLDIGYISTKLVQDQFSRRVVNVGDGGAGVAGFSVRGAHGFRYGVAPADRSAQGGGGVVSFEDFH